MSVRVEEIYLDFVSMADVGCSNVNCEVAAVRVGDMDMVDTEVGMGLRLYMELRVGVVDIHSSNWGVV